MTLNYPRMSPRPLFVASAMLILSAISTAPWTAAVAPRPAQAQLFLGTTCQAASVGCSWCNGNPLNGTGCSNGAPPAGYVYGSCVASSNTPPPTCAQSFQVCGDNINCTTQAVIGICK